ncbi:MAG TPA: DUF1800 domain-containing protein, partial [Rhodothermales bacterium]|nr:DUF1800 domain-containing protein [Rhodothermales bacterium]
GETETRSVTNGLEPYVPTADAPWNRRRALHLLRRTGFGHRAADVARVQTEGAAAAVDRIVDAALAAPLPAVPGWIDRRPPATTEPQTVQFAYQAENRAWLQEMLSEVFDQATEAVTPGTGLRERMALVWHNVAVTEVSSYTNSATWLQRYWSILRRDALGSYRTLIHEVGKTPAMLRYLDGCLNTRTSPNENYARELMELFTLGIFGPDGSRNYTQEDVTGLARALTGWRLAPYEAVDVYFDPTRFDAGTKTVFGHTGAWGYDDVVPLLFSQRSTQIAHFVARKLYRAFVYDVPDEGVVSALAAALIAADFEIAPVLRTLLKSAHFFAEPVLGAVVKSPLDVGLGFMREAGFTQTTPLHANLSGRAQQAGQLLFDPPNVAGWPGGRSWINASGLTIRWVLTDYLIPRQTTYQALAMQMPDPYHAAPLAASLAEHFLGVPVSATAAADFALIMLAGTPDYTWTPLAPEAEGRVRRLVEHLTQLPEYQLR